MIDYYVRELALPLAVEGVTIPNPDGSFDIYINSLLSAPRRKEVLEHELNHILHDHFYIDMPVSVMERQADGFLAENPAMFGIFSICARCSASHALRSV